MADNPAQTTPSLPSLVWVIPALVVIGNLGYIVWLGEGSPGSKLAEVVVFAFLVVPGSGLFLAAYAATIAWLRRSPRQRRVPVVLALASLAGLGACALALGLLVGVFMLEAALG